MKEQMTIRLPKELQEQLKQEADRIGLTLNGLVTVVLDDFASRQG